MDYREFVETLRQILSTEMEISGEKLRFEEKGGKYSETGDRLLIEFADHEESIEICAVYMEELYDIYQNGAQIEELVREIVGDIEEAKKSQIYKKAREISDYEKIKDHLFIRLLNEEKNQKALEGAVYKTIGDIAIVVYAMISEDEKGVCSAKLPENIIKMWGKDRDDIFREALLNTFFLSPPRIYKWEGLVFDPDYSGEDFMDMVSGYHIPETPFGSCLSTSKKVNGAVAVFLPGVAERLHELLNSDFYIVFTSIHEAMIHGVATAQESDLAAALHHVLDEVTAKEEFLSAHIYRYYHETRRFACVSS